MATLTQRCYALNQSLTEAWTPVGFVGAKEHWKDIAQTAMSEATGAEGLEEGHRIEASEASKNDSWKMAWPKLPAGATFVKLTALSIHVFGETKASKAYNVEGTLITGKPLKVEPEATTKGWFTKAYTKAECEIMTALEWKEREKHEPASIPALAAASLLAKLSKIWCVYIEVTVEYTPAEGGPNLVMVI